MLVADDNADMRDYLARILGHRYDVDVVADGRAALDRIAGRPPDLVLSDVMMPVLDGFGLLKEIRSDERTRSIPVILLSARAGEEARIEGLEAGADEYMVKPFSARELLAGVASQLELSRVRRETERALRDRSDQYRTLLAARAYLAAIVDSAEDAIISKNLDGIIQSCNAAAERLFGYTSDELVGRPVRILIPPDRQSEEDDILASLRAGRRVEHFETVRVTKDGRSVEVALTDFSGARRVGRDHRRLQSRSRHHGPQAGGSGARPAARRRMRRSRRP